MEGDNDETINLMAHSRVCEWSCRLDHCREGEKVTDIQWMDDALCREIDRDLFFPDHGGKSQPAKKVCRECRVQNECLTYALTFTTLLGVWGGTTEPERRILKNRKAA
jgi:WhiB family redox-sensing transcriptional regulator